MRLRSRSLPTVLAAFGVASLLGACAPSIVSAGIARPTASSSRTPRPKRLARPPRTTTTTTATIMTTTTTAARVTTTTAPTTTTTTPLTTNRKVVVAYVPFWDQARAFDDALAHTDVITDVSPWWYTVQSDGGIVTRWPNATYVDLASVRSLQAKGVRVTPVIATSSPEYSIISPILSDSTKRAAHVQKIVDLVIQNGYDGIDIDYEELQSVDRDSFTAFAQQLAAALHAHGKIATIDVFAKTTDAGYDQRNVAQDYSALGKAVDQLRLMGYDWHWSTSTAGSIAPIDWIDQVETYATSQVAASKIVMLSGLYGYDWVGSQGTALTWDQVMAEVQSTGSSVIWDTTSDTPHFTYYAGSTRHDVWFENNTSLSAKLSVDRAHGIGGVGTWRLGGEDPATWTRVANEWP